MKNIHSFFILLFAALFLTCAAHTNLEPVGRGHVNGNVSIGGPIVAAFGTRIPIPYGTIGINYGLRDRVNLNGNLHLLPLAYSVIGTDLGVTWFPVINKGAVPTLGIQPRLLALASVKKDVASRDRLRIYPLVSSSAAWPLGKGLMYTGFDLTIPISSPDYDDEASSTILSPFIGYRWHLGRRTRLLTEIKWHGANIRSDQLAVEYLPIAGHGAITTLFSIERSF
ncbi:MAG: hypothetical protein ONB05_03115 [candidate division KSB1 bacterium]|nr:hypothetical protein [candidate division KSB1 bacterium]